MSSVACSRNVSISAVAECPHPPHTDRLKPVGRREGGGVETKEIRTVVERWAQEHMKTVGNRYYGLDTFDTTKGPALALS